VNSLLGILVVGTIELKVEELEGVGVLGGSDNTEPFTHLVLLEELLGEVLEVTLREGDGRSDRKFAGTFTGELDVLTELTSLSLDLDVVYEELLVGGSIEDLVVGGSRVVDEELLGGSLDDRLLLQGNDRGGHC